MNYTGCTPMCNPLMCNTFSGKLCFAPCPQCATLRKNFNSKMAKMNGNGLNMIFNMIKLTSKAVFYILYQNILPLFTINWPLFFKMGKKSLFFIKNFISIFPGQCPQCATMSLMCNTFLGSLGVAHWVHPVYELDCQGMTRWAHGYVRTFWMITWAF